MDSKKIKRFEFFCPLCCSLQRTNTLEKITWIHHLQILTATLVFVYAGWGIFGVKGLSSYLLFWTIFEFVYRLRKRKEFVCRSCGFDPFLYRRDIQKTRHEVKNFLQQRILSEGHFQGVKLKNYQTFSSGTIEKREKNPEDLKFEEAQKSAQDTANNIASPQ